MSDLHVATHEDNASRDSAAHFVLTAPSIEHHEGCLIVQFDRGHRWRGYSQTPRALHTNHEECLSVAFVRAAGD